MRGGSTAWVVFFLFSYQLLFLVSEEGRRRPATHEKEEKVPVPIKEKGPSRAWAPYCLLHQHSRDKEMNLTLSHEVLDPLNGDQECD